MKLYTETNQYKLYNGSMLDMEEVIKPNSIDAIVTDPPYELGFMGKSWDKSGIAFQKETWKKCLSVLKPGGHLVAFGGSRTFHRIACAIEDAGFELRDTIMWIYGSGMPKSMNIGLAIDKKNGIKSEIIGYSNNTMPDFIDAGKKNSVNKVGINDGESANRIKQPIYKAQNEWDGWGTTLKPSFEPIIIARKPCEGTCIDNVLKYGVGGINIDECRVPMSDSDYNMITNKASKNPTDNYNNNVAKKYGEYALNIATLPNEQGRFPSNVILTYDETDKEEVCGGFPNSGNGNGGEVYSYKGREYNNKDTSMFNGDKPQAPSNYNDSGSASRYFYCAKANKKDRDEGLESFQAQSDKAKGNGLGRICEFCGTPQLRAKDCKCKIKSWILPPQKNIHPTVKPTELMQYLVRLVTPKGGTVLDPFNGSGSTGKACMYENKERNVDYKYIGIELTEEYLPISKARIEYVKNASSIEAIKTEKPQNYGSLFDFMNE